MFGAVSGLVLLICRHEPHGILQTASNILSSSWHSADCQQHPLFLMAFCRLPATSAFCRLPATSLFLMAFCRLPATSSLPHGILQTASNILSSSWHSADCQQHPLFLHGILQTASNILSPHGILQTASNILSSPWHSADCQQHPLLGILQTASNILCRLPARLQFAIVDTLAVKSFNCIFFSQNNTFQ